MINDLASFNPELTYNTAAHDYDAALEQFWGFCAGNTIERCPLRPGDRVLDVACGPGPATLRAAERIRPGGTVIGVDIADEMLAIAREHARTRGLDNVTFARDDMDDLSYENESFDVVTCVLGLFFAKDIVGTIKAMWDIVRPGGTLAITTLGPKFFDPMFGVFLDEVHRERPDLELSIPWRRTEDLERLRAAVIEAGVTAPTAIDEVTQVELPNPQAWWNIVRGTGVRRIEMELDRATSSRIRQANERWIATNDLRSLSLGANYIMANKS